jgi:hypothetical protein
VRFCRTSLSEWGREGAVWLIGGGAGRGFVVQAACWPGGVDRAWRWLNFDSQALFALTGTRQKAREAASRHSQAPVFRTRIKRSKLIEWKHKTYSLSTPLMQCPGIMLACPNAARHACCAVASIHQPCAHARPFHPSTSTQPAITGE